MTGRRWPCSPTVGDADTAHLLAPQAAEPARATCTPGRRLRRFAALCALAAAMQAALAAPPPSATSAHLLDLPREDVLAVEVRSAGKRAPADLGEHSGTPIAAPEDKTV